MNLLRVIIVDDEVMARKSLERLCSKNSEIEVVESFSEPKSALEFLDKEDVNLIFLDIEMPGMTGLEMLENLAKPPQVIFTTSKKEYAYEAYEFDITDFLKKPIEQNRFSAAVDKAIARYTQLNAVAVESAKSELYIKNDGKYTRVPYQDILYFESAGDYIKVKTSNKTLVIYCTMKHITEKVVHPRFLKVHRSFTVNLDHIVDIEEGTLVIGEKIIPISRAMKPILMSSINQL